MFKSQSFRTQNRVFLTKNVRDGYFPRAAHKSLLFHSVSERAPLHVLMEDGAPRGRAPAHHPRGRYFFLILEAATWSSMRREGNTFLCKGILPPDDLWSSLLEHGHLPVKVFYFIQDSSACLDFSLFYYCEPCYDCPAPMLDSEARGVMLTSISRNQCP